MVERKDCKYFYIHQKELRDITSPTADILNMPSCRIRKMSAGGCLQDCRWFEPK